MGVDATITVLSPELASQIAAGEVVERPASVVKELVENALDAGATRCDVAIGGGGIQRIEVCDDGIGMNERDALLCLERHATSKLSRFEDLDQIASFGFRGEALPSIAAVSRINLSTRARDAEAGVRVEASPGAAPNVRPIGAAPGTSIEVLDLFQNVPARRKFLRSSGTESGHVTEVVELAALARPDVSFTVTRDGKRSRSWLRTSGRQERVEQILSGEKLVRCVGERGPLKVEAYLSAPERARQGAQGLRILVNDRPVKHRALAASIAQAYGSVLERGRYPRGVVYLDVHPRLVDVNVHPQKSEVRFADPRAVTDGVYGIVAKVLAQSLSIPEPQRGHWGRATARPARDVESTPRAPSEGSEPSEDSPFEGAKSAARRAEPEGSANTERLVESAFLLRDAAERAREQPAGSFGAYRFLAQVRKTYLVCESDDGLCVLDQHAAAERVLFAKLRREYAAHAVASQALLFPVTISVSADEAEQLEAHDTTIKKLGLEVSVRGHEHVSVHSVPRLLQRVSPERLVRDLFTELSKSGGRAFSDAVDKALATMACHAAIRAGDIVNHDEASALLQALDDADFAGYCPHGRPIIASLSWAELERKVGRR